MSAPNFLPWVIGSQSASGWSVCRRGTPIDAWGCPRPWDSFWPDEASAQARVDALNAAAEHSHIYQRAPVVME